MTDEYSFLRSPARHFSPKTPRTALAAVGEGLLPAEAFIYKSGQIRAPFETPGKLIYRPPEEEAIRLDELERILARRDLDLQSYLLLVGTFEKLIQHKDPEVALFAAESINAVENRYNDRIQKTKERAESANSDGEREEPYRELAVAYYEFAILNGTRAAIRKFYLRESHNWYRKLSGVGRFRLNDLDPYVEVLLGLHLHDQARQTITRQIEAHGRKSFLLYLAAKIEYDAGNFAAVIRLHGELSEYELPSGGEKRVKFWTGKADS